MHLNRHHAIAAFLVLVGCTAQAPQPDSDPSVGDGKADGIAETQIAPRLAPVLAFLRDDANVVRDLGPEGTTTDALHKTVKVVSYSQFGSAVNLAARTVAHAYQIETNGSFRAASGLVDLLSVPDMYVEVKAGYGDDSFIDKLVVPAQRETARGLVRDLLPEAALVGAAQASETSTGNYVLVLGDPDSHQAVVTTLTYQVN